MVTSHFPVPGEEADPRVTASILAIWNQYFGSSHRVYEQQHPLPGLIVNYEDGAEDEDPGFDPYEGYPSGYDTD